MCHLQSRAEPEGQGADFQLDCANVPRISRFAAASEHSRQFGSKTERLGSRRAVDLEGGKVQWSPVWTVRLSGGGAAAPPPVQSLDTTDDLKVFSFILVTSDVAASVCSAERCKGNNIAREGVSKRLTGRVQPLKNTL